MRLGLFWQFVAILLAVMYGILAFLLVRLVLRNPIFTLLFFAAVVLVGYALWEELGGERRHVLKARLYLIIGLLIIAAEIIYFFTSVASLLETAGFLLLSAAYVLIFGKLLEAYWQSKRRYAEATLATAHFKKPYLIVNPKSGNGRAMKANIPLIAKRQGIRVVVLRKGDDVERIARRAAKAGADVLGISGGDGSIGAVVKVALDLKLPVVVLPGGTRCHFARDIGLDPDRIADALAGFSGVERRIDVGSINGRIFMNNVSFGLYADIVDHPDYRDNKLKVSRQVLQMLISGEKVPYDLRFRHGNKQFNSAIVVLVGCNAYQTMNMLELGKRTKLDGGVLQVTALLSLNEDSYKRILKSVSIERVSGRAGLRDFEQWETSSFRITNAQDSAVAGVDGECETYKTPVEVKILPKALSLYVPAEGERSSSENPINLIALFNVWNTIRSR